MKTKYIDQFILGKAKYHIIGVNGEKLTLIVDYRNNIFKILGNPEHTKATLELKSIAKDLLKRKHLKNFAEKR